MNIDPNSKVPLYFQMKEELKKKIQNGEYKDGDLLPSEKEYKKLYNLSSTTIRRALNDLVQEKYLERKAGKGSFVKVQKATRDLKSVIGFTNNMIEMGLTPSTKVLSLTTIPINIFTMERLGLKKGTEIFELKRLRMANNVPMMLETRYIRKDLCPDLDKHDLNASLWNVFEKYYGLKPRRHLQGMRITTVLSDNAFLLGIEENTPIFLIRGVTFANNNIPIECEESLYRSDKYDLTFETELD